jgi:hypothetical protein
MTRGSQNEDMTKSQSIFGVIGIVIMTTLVILTTKILSRK